MRSTSPNSRAAAGFTLIEVLIIAPIVVLVVGGLVALMITMVGDVLITRDQSNMTYDAQDALDRIEQDTRLSSAFSTTTGTLPSPQGSDSNFAGTSAFTSSASTLVLQALATDSNPAESTRRLVYYANAPNPCGSLQTYNTVFTIQVIYFIHNGSLWRRTYVPSFNLDSAPTAPNSQTICDTSTTGIWQQNSCSPGYTASRCQANDQEVMKNVSSLAIKYFSSPISTADLGGSNASKATTIEATITGQKTTVGRSFNATASLRATKINNINEN
jgi:hypothetical protein